MRHIVIGGNGFLGRNLVKSLISAREDVLVCDKIHSPDLEIYKRAEFKRIDLTKESQVSSIPCSKDDIVYHLAARQLHDKVPGSSAQGLFENVNVNGTSSVLSHMHRCGCHNLIFFSTDMVYGLPAVSPVPESHNTNPLGPYGRSKVKAEALCEKYRQRGMNITIFRPRLIVGPGRYGILTKLFWLISKHLPVPLIGNGSNRYQMISVADCVSAMAAAVSHGIPNSTYNLGSLNPPTVRELLLNVINATCSRSILISTPAAASKFCLRALEWAGMPLLYREQYMIADVNSIVDTSRARADLAWTPKHSDLDMLEAAYREYEQSREQ